MRMRRPPDPSTREEDILAAALELFSLRGYRAVGLRELAAALEMNSATLYYYFENKDKLLFRLQLDGMEKLMSMAEAALEASRDRSIAEQVEAYLRAHLEYHTGHYRTARLHWTEYKSLSPESREALRSLLKSYEQRFVALVEEGVCRGELVSDRPKITAFGLLGAGAQVANWYRPDGELPQEDVISTVLEVLMRGVLAS